MVGNVRADLMEVHDLAVPDDTDHQENVRVREDISVHIYREDYLLDYLEILVELDDPNDDKDLDTKHLVVEENYHVDASSVSPDDMDVERSRVTDDDSVHDKRVHPGPLSADDNQYSSDYHLLYVLENDRDLQEIDLDGVHQENVDG